MTEKSTKKKWDGIYQNRDGVGTVSKVLGDNLHLLPNSGVALEIACGLGANIMKLAEHGMKSIAWDISHVAIEKLSVEAKLKDLDLTAEVKDMNETIIPKDSFDVIVISHFLDRALTSPVIEALRPNGLLFYQTFTQTKVNGSGPSNKEFLLADNELLRLFKPLKLLFYREEGTVGQPTLGFRDEACFIGQKLK